MPGKNPELARLLEDTERVLKHPFWIPSLETNCDYSRLHDDHDGTREGTLGVTINQTGDIFVCTDSPQPGQFLRFRVPIVGGGRSPRTRNALMILARAIQLDNQENPIE